MDIRKIVLKNFVVLQPEWAVEQGRQFIDALQPTHIIVVEHDPQDRYDLFSVKEALAFFARARRNTPVVEALHLKNRLPTPVVESHTRIEQVPSQCVVVEDGDLLGFFDVDVPWQPGTTRSGKHTGQEEEPLALETRSVVAEYPEQVALQEVFSLQILLSALLAPLQGKTLPLALPPGAQVDIIIQPKRGLQLETRNESSLLITSAEETLPIQFKLRGIELGPGQVDVRVFYQGQCLGILIVNIDVLESAPMPVPQHYNEQSLGHIYPRPDLSLEILQHTRGERPSYIFRLTAPDPALKLNIKPFGPFSFEVSPSHYFQEFFADIEALPLWTNEDLANAEQELAAKGMQLFSLLPPDLQQLLWSLRHQIQSVIVQSEEPWVPWELCKMYTKENGHTEEGPFLCEAFAMTRWMPALPIQPRLTLQNMALVIPTDSGLPQAHRERDYLLALANQQRRVTRIQATPLEVSKALASGQYDGWHFTGHGGLRGSDPNRSAMYLEKRARFTPERLKGTPSNLGLATPLVFLNACQIGRSAMSLTDIGGWAKEFLNAGAGAFIGAYWSVNDETAADFAKELYNRLLIGMPIGKAVQQARLAIKSAGDSTWLAYTVFADPLATVRPSQSNE